MWFKKTYTLSVSSQSQRCATSEHFSGLSGFCSSDFIFLVLTQNPLKFVEVCSFEWVLDQVCK